MPDKINKKNRKINEILYGFSGKNIRIDSNFTGLEKPLKIRIDS